MAELSSLPGTYLLLLQATERRAVTVGQLGVLDLRPGWYAYVGSALGSGGVRARVRHHLRISRSPHWHLDVLRPHVQVVGAWVMYGRDRREHAWVSVLGGLSGTSLPLRRFGASDCRCSAHLFRFLSPPLPGTDTGEALAEALEGPDYVSLDARGGPPP